MLFLAVFWGFLAEYQLEHKIEKEYIQSMDEDLKNDTLSLGLAIKRNMEKIKGKDSFILLLDKGTWTKEEVATLYNMHWNYMVTRTMHFFPNALSTN